MTGDEVAAWLGSIFPGMELLLIDGAVVALSSLHNTPVAVTAGFSAVDTGLVVEADGETEVRCEIVLHADVDKQLLGQVVVEAAGLLQRLGVPAQPGVLLEGLLEHRGLAVRHGLLREPELFAQGTPLYREPGRITLLLELIALTDDEFEIASEQGYPALATRLRRRGTNVADWSRGGQQG